MKTRTKTNKSAKKRFKATGSGNFKRNKGWKSHLLTGKSRARKRKLRKAEVLNENDFKRVKRMLPYE